MPRPVTGNIYEKRGRWYARIRLGVGERILVPLATCKTEEQANVRRTLLVDLASRLRSRGSPVNAASRLLIAGGASEINDLPRVVEAVAALCTQGAAQERPTTTHTATGLTFGDIGSRWTSGDLARSYPDHITLKRSAESDRQRLQKHVYPHVKDVLIPQFTLDHAQKVMRSLPPECSAGTRRQVAQLMIRIMSMAVFPLRLIKVSPIPRGFLPSPGKAKALAYLYPDEDLKLLGCAEVPLCYRVLYGFLAREGLRRSEAYSLTLAEFDLDRGAITLDKNKTDDPRAWALGQDVVVALRAWVSLREASAGQRLPRSAPMFTNVGGDQLRETQLAHYFRGHLLKAGVDRAELHTSTDVRKRIRVHDLRGTFVTLALANAKSEAWVMDRTGHKSSEMVNRYRRAARTIAELALGSLAPMNEAIPELRTRCNSVSSPE